MGGNFDRNPKGGIALRPIRLRVRAKHPRERNSRPNHRRHKHHYDALQGETQHQKQRCHDRLTHYRSHQRRCASSHTKRRSCPRKQGKTIA